MPIIDGRGVVSFGWGPPGVHRHIMLPTSELFHVNAEQCSCVVLYETGQKYSTLRMSNIEILAFQFQICYQHWSRSNNAAVIKAIIPNPQTHYPSVDPVQPQRLTREVHVYSVESYEKSTAK